MRSLLILIDGLGDDPIPAWEGSTPFLRAVHPAMDSLRGKNSEAISQVSISENDITPGSLTCILRLLGVPKEQIPKNRAYLELLSYGRDVSEYEMVLRCNLVSSDKAGRMVAFNCMGLNEEEMNDIAAKLCSFYHDVEFIHLSDYRNLIIMSREEKVLSSYTAPPHESMGLDTDSLLASLKESSLQMKLVMEQADRLMQAYGRDGLTYRLYPWGAATRTQMPSFNELNGLSGALVCRTEIVRGIGKGLKMHVPDLENGTADVDTDVAEKFAVTKKVLQEYPFVMAHFNGTDEAAHRHDFAGKAEFISRIDKEFVAPLLEELQEPLRIVICGDHVTSSVTGRHTRGTGPVLAATLYPVKGEEPGAADQYESVANGAADKYGNVVKTEHMESYRDIIDFLLNK